jgi:hypothetical protein
MPRIQNTITIDRPVFDVFRFVADFEKADQWQPNLISTNLIESGPTRVGTMIALNRRFMGRTVFVSADVTEFQNNRKLELKGVMINFPYIRTIETQSSGGRQTRVTDTIEIKTGCLYFWYSPLLRTFLGGQINQEWGNLKHLLETRTETM